MVSLRPGSQRRTRIIALWPGRKQAFGESNEISGPIGYRAAMFMKAVDEDHNLASKAFANERGSPSMISDLKSSYLHIRAFDNSQRGI